jgi:hypothetical protein
MEFCPLLRVECELRMLVSKTVVYATRCIDGNLKNFMDFEMG